MRLQLPSVASPDDNCVYRIDLPWSSVGPLGGFTQLRGISSEDLVGVQSWPASFRLFTFNWACLIWIYTLCTEGPTFTLPVAWLLRTHGLWNHPCHYQLTQFEGNLSDVVKATIDSLRVLLWWIHYYWLWPTWSLMCLLRHWPLESTRTVSAIVINWVYLSSILVSAICHIQMWMITHCNVSQHISGGWGPGIRMKWTLVQVTSIW